MWSTHALPRRGGLPRFLLHHASEDENGTAASFTVSADPLDFTKPQHEIRFRWQLARAIFLCSPESLLIFSRAIHVSHFWLVFSFLSFHLLTFSFRTNWSVKLLQSELRAIVGEREAEVRIFFSYSHFYTNFLHTQISLCMNSAWSSQGRKKEDVYDSDEKGVWVLELSQQVQVGERPHWGPLRLSCENSSERAWEVPFFCPHFF